MRSDELIPGLSYREFLGEARRHRTEDEFRRSPFFEQHGAGLEKLLLLPRIERAAPAGRGAATADRLRVVQWNIEKGRSFDGIVRRLREDPWLREAHLYCLNEVDDGTARGGNRDQAVELGRALGCSSIFLPCFLECTRGVGDDLRVPGEHLRGLQGLAILSRLPVIDARAVSLPSCFDTFDFHEKRFGGRRGLYARLEWRGRPLVVGATHLEVRNTPKCRARQFRAFLDGFHEASRAWFGGSANSFLRGAAGEREVIPAVLTGDWNTNTFRRGSIAPSVREFFRIVSRSPAMLAEETAWPLRREPLFADLAAAGFDVSRCNQAAPTAAQDLGSVEDLGHLPAPLANLVRRAAGLAGREVRMRLDWIASRGLRATSPPVTLPAGEERGTRISDHAVIGAEFR